LQDTVEESLEVTGETVWSQFISIDLKTNELRIKHNNNPGVLNNTEFNFYLMGISAGLK